MQKPKREIALIILMMTLGLVAFSPVFSALTTTVTVGTSGTIALPPVNDIARSGSAIDIQASVDFVAAQGGGNVYIPAGTFNFVEVGQPWQTVTIPAGVNVFGAPTERDANGQVIQWNTVLMMPYDVPGSWTTSQPAWFRITGTGDPNKPTRISDIKIVGYRSIDPSSVTLHHGIAINNVIDFRIDHMMLEHTCGGGISINGLNTRGVIDHNQIINLYGFDNLNNYVLGNIGYGVEIHGQWGSQGAVPYRPLSEILGKYTSGSIYIEDNYFSKWRHVVSSGDGGMYVFRYNTVNEDFGHYSMDAHGLREAQTGWAGSRLAEIYENTFTNAVITDFRGLFHPGGGSGVWFNNYVDTSYRSNGIALSLEDDVPSETWHLKDFYLWSTKGPWVPAWDGIAPDFTADRNVLADWNRNAFNQTDPAYPNVDPSWSIAGYIPYTYPHPLTVQP